VSSTRKRRQKKEGPTLADGLSGRASKEGYEEKKKNEAACIMLLIQRRRYTKWFDNDRNDSKESAGERL